MQITYLEMRQPPQGDAAPPPAGVEVAPRHGPTPEQYLRWYQAVGDDWNWGDRLRMDREELKSWLSQRGIEIWLLTVAGSEAGYCELDSRSDDVELVYFGLFPDFIGQGLGKWFLDWTVRHAWSRPATRVWLHTCEADHPAALPNYQRAGFRVYQTKSS